MDFNPIINNNNIQIVVINHQKHSNKYNYNTIQ